MTTKSRVAVILPPRERFRPNDAGAVALTVHDFVIASRFRQQIVVLGGESEPFADINYHYVASPWAWLLGLNYAYAQACTRWLCQQNINVIEVHNRITLALRLKKSISTAVVFVHLHNDPHGMEGAKTPQQRQRLLQSLNGVYCVSHYVKQRLLEGVSSEWATKVHVIHNAIAVTAEPSTFVKQQWLVYAGRFIPEKGVLQLAQALAEVLPRFPQWRAVFLGAWGFGHVAGRTEYEQQVYAALAQVAEQVEFRGHVPQTAVMATLAQSLVTIVPSTCGEAFGRVALEAMLTKNAVLVSAFGALPEIAGDAALVLPEVTQGCLVRYLSDLLPDEQRISEVAMNCQQRALTEFGLHKQVQYLDDIRQQLLEEA